MPPMPRLAAPHLRRTLSVAPINGQRNFVLNCRRLIFEYCDQWGSATGMRNFAQTRLAKLAEENPQVEFVLRRRQFHHPHIRGIYANGRDKVICVRNLQPNAIEAKAQLLLDSSGKKMAPLRRPYVASTTESVRGIWSAFHDYRR